jgi:hypothetical protein
MSTKLYVGNLAFQTTSHNLQELFASAGTVESETVLEEARSRGFGFVEITASSEGRYGHTGKVLVGPVEEIKGAALIDDTEAQQQAQPFFAGITESRKRVRRLQTQINHLKKKTQAIIDKLP